MLCFRQRNRGQQADISCWLPPPTRSHFAFSQRRRDRPRTLPARPSKTRRQSRQAPAPRNPGRLGIRHLIWTRKHPERHHLRQTAVESQMPRLPNRASLSLDSLARTRHPPHPPTRQNGRPLDSGGRCTPQVRTKPIQSHTSLRSARQHMAGLGQPRRTSGLAPKLRISHLESVGTTPMKAKPSTSEAAPKAMTAVQRGQAAAKAMAKELRAEHKRWNLPLLSWKDGKVVATKP
jgi:hypothetical protein